MSPRIISLLNMLEIGQTFRNYAEGTALVMGLFGNTMTVLVLCRKSMRTFSPGIYFIFLAISDSINLLAGVPHDLAGYTRSGYGNSYNVLTCQLSLFFVRATGFFSMWTVVAVTVDRFIAVVFPFKVKELCTVKRALIIEVVFILIAVAKHAEYFWMRGEQTVLGRSGQNVTINCGWTSSGYAAYAAEVENLLSLFVGALIPLFIILVLNGFILFTVIRTAKAAMSKNSRSNSLTFMLMTVSLTLFLLAGPHLATLTVMTFVLDTSDQESVLVITFTQTITVSLMFFNQAFNFYVYCLTGSRFRSELREMLCCSSPTTPALRQGSSRKSKGGITQQTSIKSTGEEKSANATTDISKIDVEIRG